ncbi:MAG: DegV family protein [Clostridia bacterium]|nr:DegV family protein [Clostridia bacterium]
MKKFEISTDSNCDLYANEIKEMGLYVGHLFYTIEKGKELNEYVDDFKEYDDYVKFYQTLRSGAVAKTSILSLQAHIDLFTEMAQNGVKVALHIAQSDGLSPTIDNANKAIEIVKEKFPDIDYRALECKTTTIGEAMLVKLACKLRDEGKSRDEVYEIINAEKMHVQHFVLVDDLMYLKRGGRIGGASAAIGTLLAIKPVIEFNKLGKLEIVRKERGMKKALKSIVDEFAKYTKNKYFDIMIVHTDNVNAANQLADMLNEKYGIRPEIRIMGPIIGAHVGPNAVAYAFISNEERPN